MDMRDIRAIGAKPKKRKAPNEGFKPSRKRIERMCAKFRAAKMPNPESVPLDDDCDAELEGEADRACR